MSDLIRFGVSLEKKLLEKFDTKIKADGYKNRSNAIADLIRENLIKKEYTQNRIVNGVIILVYDHHHRDLVNRMTNIQHDYHKHIISSQHIHLDHINCFEIIIVSGKPKMLKEISGKLKAEKGVKMAKLSLATTGEDV